MHPLLVRRRRLVAYLLAWVPILALLSYVDWSAGGPRWTDGAEVLAPAVLFYAFVCLTPWYVCRSRPLRPSSIGALAFTHAGAAFAASLILAGSVWLSANLLNKPLPRLPVLYGIGVLLYLVSVGLHYAALAAAASSEAEKRAAEARELAREAELEVLRIQINPHFLFNSLHSISALTTADGIRAREMCVRLADFLRTSLGLGKRESISLREELALARSYLEVERIRFGDRLQFDQQIGDTCLDCMVPPLLLQPLVENAVKHGISSLVEGGAIRLEAGRDGPDVRITLENAFDPEAAPRRSLGMGLNHVKRRLEVRYGKEAQFETGADGSVYRVVLRFPCESPMASSSRA
jgi:two-component system, LytTR family, sensor histidine kinase AlgZ